MHLPQSLSKKLLLPVAALACAAGPSTADAAVTCSVSANTLTVTLTSPGQKAAITRHLDGISVNGDACGPYGAGQLSAIDVVDTSGGSASVSVNLSNGGLAGGGFEIGAGEVEIDADLGGGIHDQFTLVGSSSADVVRGGDLASGGFGMKVNEDDDVDVTATGTEHAFFQGNDGNDDIRLHGSGTGFSGPLSIGASLLGGGHDDVLVGGANDDLLVGETGDDVMSGGDGEDTFRPGADDDKMSGGPKGDAVSYTDAPAGVAVDLGKPGEQDTGSSGSDQVNGVEMVVGSNHGDTLRGAEAGEGFYGLSGNDVVHPGGGDDSVDGGANTDTISYADAKAGVTVDLAGLEVSGGAGTDAVTFVENVLGTPFDDVIDGSDGANVLEGLGGADTLKGRGGADVIGTREGAKDTVECGADADEVVADLASIDTVAGDCESVDRPAEPAPAVDLEPVAPATTTPADTKVEAVPPPVDRSAPALPALPALRLAVKAASKQKLGKGVTLSVACPDRACSIVAAGRVTLRTRRGRAARTLTLAAVKAAVGQGGSRRVVVKVPARTARKIAAALRLGAKATVSLDVKGAAAGALPARAVATVRLAA